MDDPTISPCINSDFETICEIINDAAQASKGIIPDTKGEQA